MNARPRLRPAACAPPVGVPAGPESSSSPPSSAPRCSPSPRRCIGGAGARPEALRPRSASFAARATSGARRCSARARSATIRGRRRTSSRAGAPTCGRRRTTSTTCGSGCRATSRSRRRVRFTGSAPATGKPDPHRKACLVIRQSLDSDAPYADAATHGDGLTSLQWRDAKGAVTHEVQSSVVAPRASPRREARRLRLDVRRERGWTVRTRGWRSQGLVHRRLLRRARGVGARHDTPRDGDVLERLAHAGSRRSTGSDDDRQHGGDDQPALEGPTRRRGRDAGRARSARRSGIPTRRAWCTSAARSTGCSA